MDKIHLNNLTFHAYHGNLEEETKLGQKFIIDLEVAVDLRPAGASDCLADSICYSMIFECVRKVVEDEHFNLLERLGTAIVARLFEFSPDITEIRVVVKKPQAPIQGVFNYVGIELKRSRNDYLLSGPGQ